MAGETRFEWDRRKSAANRRKHGIDFGFAELVFRDPFRKLENKGHEHGEIRWHTIGEVRGALYLVAHTLEDQSEVEKIRIISARGCTRRERERYEEAP